MESWINNIKSVIVVSSNSDRNSAFNIRETVDGEENQNNANVQSISAIQLNQIALEIPSVEDNPKSLNELSLTTPIQENDPSCSATGTAVDTHIDENPSHNVKS